MTRHTESYIKRDIWEPDFKQSNVTYYRPSLSGPSDLKCTIRIWLEPEQSPPTTLSVVVSLPDQILSIFDRTGRHQFPNYTKPTKKEKKQRFKFWGSMVKTKNWEVIKDNIYCTTTSPHGRYEPHLWFMNLILHMNECCRFLSDIKYFLSRYICAIFSLSCINLLCPLSSNNK